MYSIFAPFRFNHITPLRPIILTFMLILEQVRLNKVYKCPAGLVSSKDRDPKSYSTRKGLKGVIWLNFIGLYFHTIIFSVCFFI